jgi:hypothetical protein
MNEYEVVVTAAMGTSRFTVRAEIVSVGPNGDCLFTTNGGIVRAFASGHWLTFELIA